MLYVGIDPGVHAAGVAVCDGSSALQGALWARADGTAGALGDDVANAVLVALAVLKVPTLTLQGVTIGIEFPEVTRGRARGAARTEDLLELAWAVGRIEEALRGAMQNTHVMRVAVRTWKANVNSDVLAARLKLEPPVGLTGYEWAHVQWPAPSYRHNVVDAICLARWLSAWPWKNPGASLNDHDKL